MKALVYDAPRKFEYRDVPDPELDANHSYFPKRCTSRPKMVMGPPITAASP